ncbi:methyltransferase-like protein 23 isoform X1 [Leptotrombidium deliense]|uniref:Methyltransferase-like protein 23 isoform X1 n=1 Tax=Leptotrombidium deliense TaxID=299467 RepID=A0A443SFG1_9ACAR|nr:methyltransferase-like protein 23 isoform X1 [Leptotrombidium deliense]
MEASQASTSSSVKQFTFTDERCRESLTVKINSRYGLHLWPSAPVLSQFIFFNRDLFADKNVIELGAGTSMPGIVAAKIGAKVILTDAHQNEDCFRVCKHNVTLNDLSIGNEVDSCVRIMQLTWAYFTEDMYRLKHVNFIIASDCFYDQKDFEDILATVSFIIENSENKCAVFYTSYEERHAEWNIECLLRKWDLQCEYIELTDFSASHLCNNHTIHLLKIMK